MPWNPPLPEGEWLLRRAEELAVKDSAPEPILQGRQLIKIGYKPGPALGKILKAAFEAQLDGAFEDIEGGIDWVRSKTTG